MKNQFITLLALCGLLFTGCEKDTPTSDEGNNLDEVKDIRQFVSVAAGQTSMPEYGQLPSIPTNFQEGDEISIYFWKDIKDETGGATGKIYLLKEKAWTPKTENDSIFWGRSDEKLFFAGMYPTREVQDIKADNITSNDKDILVANIVNGVKPQNDAIRFSFKHLFSEIRISISYGTEHYEGDYTSKMVELKNISESGIYNHVDMVFIPSESKNNFKLSQEGTTSTFTGKILPQELSVIEFSAESNDKQFSCTFNPASLSEDPNNIPQNFIIQANKIYTYNFKAGKDKLELQSVAVEDWIQGQVISGNADKKE